ncbi:MAG: hypothetical protein HC902_09850 [Calothrix sp. SM1_5_4]|nr:hypothetical protein [Calothrix sp. SM1_5_4]
MRGLSSPGQDEGDVDLSSFDAILASSKMILHPGDPENSLLYTVVARGEMPPRQPLNAELTERLRQWILTLPAPDSMSP